MGNKTGVHFQPWPIVNNLWGASAMMLTGSRHVTESGGGAQYPTLPANWGPWTASGDSVLSLKSAHVESLTNANSLAAVDAAWAEMLNLKHTKSITYDKCFGAWKYSCNTIKWEVSQAAKLTTGILDTTQGSTKYFPASIKGDIAKLAAQLPGLQAYAVTTTMTAVIGWGGRRDHRVRFNTCSCGQLSACRFQHPGFGLSDCTHHFGTQAFIRPRTYGCCN